MTQSRSPIYLTVGMYNSLPAWQRKTENLGGGKVRRFVRMNGEWRLVMFELPKEVQAVTA